MLLCKFCCKECKNANSLRNHERLCKSNPSHRKLKVLMAKELRDLGIRV